ncbi:hypothetical protein [Candidatus Sulfurimonas baltica]|uniref:HNH endonuclease n=1 Tax=Candidatus Sulfurimonas baltica TaxID=2740404 RepID=A0A7S7RLW2_9BACT|nr:hypothetical protein [Candidatus Sulfurimonas baltica]QOY50939.1 hypothetical protein HUE88_07220 [Candidatus Sulfurimonas baltica]
MMATSFKNGNEGKYCSVCDDWKELHEYHNETAKGSSQGGKQNVCKECVQKRNKK